MDSLAELENVCRAAETEKASERKKQIEKLKLILDKQNVINGLCKNSQKKKTSSLTWNNIFQLATRLFDLDVSAINKGKECSQNVMVKKRQEALSLIKHVVHRAGAGGGCYLHADEIVNLLIEILRDTAKREAFGSDLSNLVMKDVLSTRGNWCGIEPDCCQPLITLYCRFLIKPPACFDRVTIAKALWVIVSGVTQHFDLIGDPLFKALTEFFTNISAQDRSSLSLLEPLVRVVNILCKSTVADCRMQVCHLGESAFVPLLHVWKNKPSERLKDDIVDFYQIQLACHHPHGVTDEQSGSAAFDSEQWKGHLRKLYETLYSDIEEIKLRSRTRFFGSGRDVSQYLLRENIVQLAADVCRQVFVDGASFIEVTQLSSGTQLATQPGGAAKRRRIDSGWAMLRDAISSNGNSLLAIPWLQLLRTILIRYPDSLSSEEFAAMLTSLHQLLVDSKLPDVTIWLLRCLLALAQNSLARHRTGAQLDSDQLCAINGEWTKLWSSSLRFVTIHSTQDDSLNLIGCLLDVESCKPGHEVWSWFESNAIRPTNAALRFLASYLKHCSIRESQRLVLLQWLLPIRMENIDDDFLPACTHLDAGLLAEIAVALTVRHVRACVNDLSLLTPARSVFSEVERSCLLLTFDEAVDLPLGPFLDSAHCDDMDSSRSTSSVLSNVMQQLIERVLADMDYALSTLKPEVKCLESVAWQCCLAVKIVNCGLSRWHWTNTNVLSSDIFTKLKRLMEAFSRNISSYVSKTGVTSLSAVLTSLCDMASPGSPTPSAGCIGADLAALCRATVPQSLIVMLTAELKSQLSSSTNVPAAVAVADSRPAARLSTRVQDPLDLDFDMESDETAPSNSSSQTVVSAGTSALDDQFNVSQSQEASGSTSGGDSLLSSALLTENQSVLLQCADLLCFLCRHPATSNDLGNAVAAETSDIEIVRSLTQLIDCDDDNWSCTQAFSMQLIYRITKGLTTHLHRLVDEAVDCLVYTLHEVSKAHRRDQDISQMVLELMTRLIPHLCGGNNHSAEECGEDHLAELVKHREIVVNMFGVYWTKRNEMYNRPTRLAVIRCITTFIMYDPAGSWTVWNCKDGRKLMKDELIESLNDRHCDVRLQAAVGITCLFGETKAGIWEPYSRLKQDKLFDSVYTKLRILSEEVKDISDALECKDERWSRTCSILHTLACISRVSLVCRRKALFAVIQMIRENGFGIEPVRKMLSQLCRLIGSKDLYELLSAYLPYLMQTWLSCKMGSVFEFPWRLIGFESLQDFLRDHPEHRSPIVACLVMRKNVADIREMANLLQTDMKTLLTDCLAHILVHILPLSAATQDSASLTTSQAAGQRHLKMAAIGFDCYNLLITELGKMILERSVVDNLNDIVVGVLTSLYDADSSTAGDYVAFIRDSDAEPSLPHFPSPVIMETLQYLTQKHSAHASSLVLLLAMSQDGIQHVILSLSTHLARQRSVADRCRAFVIYCIFVRLLLRDFRTGLGGAATFVLRSVLHTVLSTINSCRKGSSEKWLSRHSDLMRMSIDLLNDILSVAVDSSPQELCRYLPAIVSSLAPLPSEAYSEEISKTVEQIINFLLVENCASLSSTIVLLEPLPDLSVFAAARDVYHKFRARDGGATLQKEIQWFLDGRQSCGLACANHVAGLKYLCSRLSARNELAKLIASCQEDPGGLLTKLLRQLIEIIRARNNCNGNGDDTSVVTAAGRCLGAIGLVDMRVVTLNVDKSASELDLALGALGDDTKMKRYCLIFHALYDYLTDPDIDIVHAASTVLKHLLSRKSGVDFYITFQSKFADSHLLQCLHPFKNDGKRKTKQPALIGASCDFASAVDDASIWCPTDSCYDMWISNLVCSLIGSGAVKDELLQLLAPVCKTKVKFCELLLPHLMHDILTDGTDRHEHVLSKQIGRFFREHCVAKCVSSPVGTLACKPLCTDKRAVCAMLSVVHYLRQQQKDKSGTAWDNNFWLQLDYLHLAEAAISVSSYFTALMYAEIWCEIRKEEIGPIESCGTEASLNTDLDSLTDLSDESSSGVRMNVKDVMLEAYKAIGDPDGVYGCGTGKLEGTASRINMYQHENEWYKAVGSYDLEMSFNPSSSSQVGLVKALQNLGHRHVLDVYLQGLDVNNGFGTAEELREIQYEAACRNCRWDLDASAWSDVSCGYNQLMYSCLLGLKQKDESLFDQSLGAARSCVLRDISHVGEESLRSLYPTLSRLQCISELESAAESLLRSSDGSSSGILDVVTNWQHPSHAVAAGAEFGFVEPILTQRCTLANIAVEVSGESVGSRQTLYSMLETLAKTARRAQRFQVAEGALNQLRKLSLSMPVTPSPCSWRVEEAELFWARGEPETAKRLMKTLINDLEKENAADVTSLLPKCLLLYGDWLAATRSERPSIVLERYLSKAADLLEKDISRSCETAVDAFYSLARYVDSQYQHIVDHMNSAAFEAKQEHIRKSRNDTEQLRKLGETASDDIRCRYFRTLEKQRQIDEQEQRMLLADRQKFLLCAISNYTKCLRFHNKHDLVVFRLTSLWFDNSMADTINESMKSAVKDVSSHKFLPLMYQLAARMSQTQNSFQSVLHQLLQQIVVDHPHHSVGIILSLANASLDSDLLKVRNKGTESMRLSRSTLKDDGSLEEDRVLAARIMVLKLKKLKCACAPVVVETERLCVAYVELANYNVDKYKSRNNEPIKLPTELLITKMKDLTHVSYPTLDIKVELTGNYKDIVHVAGFQPNFTLAGGINLPKIISCVGSDGVARRQLVKGKDDLRQDAVMQQVFGMVNRLLVKHPETRRRNLNVRTYKVVPLSQRSGLLEWCEGTVPMGEYLIGTKGAHQRYRPDDTKAADCRKQLAEAHASGSEQTKYQAFCNIANHFQPVFHHFFLEKFPSPADWYEKRLAYVRSVATNSMVGYILGLGDRHVQNILIDCQTAELIHIDLGVAFEQGRILPTPETVPFRLTRDIVDGMGVAGVEGIFRRCCEKTMELMHESHEAILTIVQVLLYDPLYVWTISPIRAYQLQHRHAADPDITDPNMNTTTADLLDSSGRTQRTANQEMVNKVAERVLLRLKQKLCGLEDGVQLSVTGQVNHLIREARDPTNLCRLFPGWQAYI